MALEILSQRNRNTERSPLRERIAHSVPERFRKYLPGIRYLPLDGDKKEIRVLHLEPNSNLDDKNSIIRCRVEHVSLLAERPPAYHAISYCWGQHSGASKVILNGHKITVPASAEAAIRGTCRSSVRERIPIWIDAICINQFDVKEKNSQVASMGNVYSKASEVLVWLGDDEEGSAEAAFASIENLLAWHSAQKKGTPSGEESKVDLRQLMTPPFYDAKAVCDVAAAPWFLRLWAVQEVVLAASATCYRGAHSIDWSQIAKFAMLAYQVPGMFDTLLYGVVEHGAEQVFFTGTLAASSMKAAAVEARDLSELLIVGRNFFKTSDLRDKIYGMLGLQSLGENVIVPDYGKSLKEVYTNATVMALREHLRLRPETRNRLFCEAQRAAIVTRYPGSDHSVDAYGCPSWVPRYDLPVVLTDGAAAYVPCTTASANVELCFEYDTAKPDVLRVKGCLVDTVGRLHGFEMPRQRDEEVMDNGEGEFWERICLLIPSYAEDLNGLWRSMFSLPRVWSAEDVDKLAKTLVVGAYTDFQTASQQALADFSALALRCKGFDPNPADLPPDDVLIETGARRGSAETYFRRFYVFIRNRIPFTTRDKGLQGMGPIFMEADDVVCILYGSPTPLILRKEGPYWRLLGDTYLHGIMDGKFIEQRQENGTLEAESQWFDIH